MNTTPLKMIVIVAEPVLEARLVAELRDLGATGCTITDGRGEGSSPHVSRVAAVSRSRIRRICRASSFTLSGLLR